MLSEDDEAERIAFVAELIEHHARSHQNSNSSYGHVCPSTCLAQTVVMFIDRWQPGAFVSYDGTIQGLTQNK